MATKSSKRPVGKKRSLPPGSGTTPKPGWWPPNVPWPPDHPINVEEDIWWRLCQQAIQEAHNRTIALGFRITGRLSINPPADL